MRIDDYGARVVFWDSGEVMKVGEPYSSGVGQVILKTTKPPRVLFDGSESLLIEGTSGPREIGVSAESPDIPVLHLFSPKGQEVFAIRLHSPGSYVCGPRGRVLDSGRLRLSAGIQPLVPAMMCALGLSPERVTRVPSIDGARCEVRAGEPEYLGLGETVQRVVTDGTVHLRHSRPIDEVSANHRIEVSGGTFLAVVEQTIATETRHAIETATGTRLQSAAVDVKWGAWPNTLETVSELKLTPTTELEQALRTLMLDLYGPAAREGYCAAFQSLQAAQQFLELHYRVTPYPGRGDLLCIQFRDGTPLDSCFTLVPEGELSPIARALLTMFGEETPPTTRPGQGPEVLVRGDSIVFSLHTEPGREAQEPLALQRLLESYGPQLFSPWFGEQNRSFIQALECPVTAARYLTDRTRVIRRGCADSAESELVWTERGSSEKSWRAIDDQPEIVTSRDSDHDLYAVIRAHWGSPRFRILCEKMAESAEAHVQTHPTEPVIQGVELEGGTFFVVTDRRGSKVPVGDRASVVPMNLLDEDFQKSVRSLEPEGVREGFDWQLPSKIRIPGESMVFFVSEALQEHRGSGWFGRVLAGGVRLYADQDRALICLAPGEEGELRWVTRRTSFKGTSPTDQSTRGGPEYVVAAVHVQRDLSGRLRFSPPSTDSRFTCGGPGLEPWMPVRLASTQPDEAVW